MKKLIFPQSPKSRFSKTMLSAHRSSHQLLPITEEGGDMDEAHFDRGGEFDENEEPRESYEVDNSPFIYFSASQWLTAISWPWWFLLTLAIFVTGFLIISMTTTLPPTNLQEHILTSDGKSFPSGQLTWSQKFTPLPCGKSPAEARDRGCHFDIIATAWLPQKCIDYELISEFEALYPWQYFSNSNGTDPFPDDSDTLGSQTGLIWTTHRWHSAHCLFMWKKLNRALVQGRLTDGETIKQGHTDHCSKVIFSMKELDSIGSIVEIIYPPC